MSVVPAVLIVLFCENVSMKFRSIASGMTTGTIGTTARKKSYRAKMLCWKELRFPELGFNLLTPTDKRDGNDVSCGDLAKHKHQLLEHEHGLCSHPHPCYQCKVVD